MLEAFSLCFSIVRLMGLCVFPFELVPPGTCGRFRGTALRLVRAEFLLRIEIAPACITAELVCARACWCWHNLGYRTCDAGVYRIVTRR
jgi:hypothetical protein